MQQYTSIQRSWYYGIADKVNPINIFRNKSSGLEAMVKAAPASNDGIASKSSSSRLRYFAASAAMIAVLAATAACSDRNDIKYIEDIEYPTPTATATGVPATPTPDYSQIKGAANIRSTMDELLKMAYNEVLTNDPKRKGLTEDLLRDLLRGIAYRGFDVDEDMAVTLACLEWEHGEIPQEVINEVKKSTEDAMKNFSRNNSQDIFNYVSNSTWNIFRACFWKPPFK